MIHRPDRYDPTPTFGSEEHATCKHFGCGRKLSMQEILYGVYCINHQPRNLLTVPPSLAVNKMSILINGSLCLTDLVAKAKEGHSAFKKGKNEKIYVSITEWVNDDPDKFGNHVSYQLNSTKEKKEAEGKVYIGNGKKSEASGGAPVTASDADALNLDGVGGSSDLPF